MATAIGKCIEDAHRDVVKEHYARLGRRTVLSQDTEHAAPGMRILADLLGRRRHILRPPSGPESFEHFSLRPQALRAQRSL